MELAIYQVDAFARRPFEGNPAAVVPLAAWLSDATMEAIAAQNNLSETAFVVPDGDGFHIRWFTPTREVRLCGHATLATAFVIFNTLRHESNRIVFESPSGPLTVTRTDELLTLDFPAQPPSPCDIPPDMKRALGKEPVACLKSEDYIAVFESEDAIAGIHPDETALRRLDSRGVIVTAPGETADFVLRFFAPKYGIPEDPVTGSAFTQRAPYWSRRLARDRLHARQISTRGGEVVCEHRGDRVLISGGARTYMTGRIAL